LRRVIVGKLSYLGKVESLQAIVNLVTLLAAQMHHPGVEIAAILAVQIGPGFLLGQTIEAVAALTFLLYDNLGRLPFRVVASE
jgi:hypothetical protein